MSDELTDTAGDSPSSPVYQSDVSLHEKQEPCVSSFSAIPTTALVDNNALFDNDQVNEEGITISSTSDSAQLQTSGDTGTSVLSTEAFETDIQVDQSEHKEELIEDSYTTEPMTLERKDRLRSSSYEDIYVDVKAPLEDDSEILIPSGPLQVGDRFEGKHFDSQFVDGKASSFENLYEASSKEAEDIDDKDIDEKDAESDLDRPEKGEGEDEKYYVQSPPQMFMSTRTDTDYEVDVTSPVPIQKATPQPGQYGSPIDVTLECGLDQVGQETTVQQHSSGTRGISWQIEERADSLERSQSYEVGHEHEGTSDRHRHYSSPDAVLHAELADEHVDKGI